MAQRFKIITTTKLDDDENMDVIDTAVDYETIPHDEPIGPLHFRAYGELEDSEFDVASGQYTLMVFSRQGTYYDRSAEVVVPVWIETSVEPVEPEFA